MVLSSNFFMVFNLAMLCIRMIHYFELCRVVLLILVKTCFLFVSSFAALFYFFFRYLSLPRGTAIAIVASLMFLL